MEQRHIAVGPVTASSLSVTTTRGDIIRRGASADERLALGTRGYVMRAGATDPAGARSRGTRPARCPPRARTTQGRSITTTTRRATTSAPRTRTVGLAPRRHPQGRGRLGHHLRQRGAVHDVPAHDRDQPRRVRRRGVARHARRRVCRSRAQGERVISARRHDNGDGAEALSLLLGDPALLVINTASGAVEFELTPPDVAAWEWKLTVRVSEITT